MSADSPSAAKTPRINHVFVDYENIHEIDLALVFGKPIIVHLVLGQQHKKLAVEIVEQLLQFPQQVRLVKANKSGKNALDFVLAYHVGVESQKDPLAFFHIVSNDTGFDALILHLKTLHIFARRDDSFVKAFETAPPATVPVTIAERVRVMAKRLQTNEKNRPKRKKTLLSQINNHYQKQLTETELEAIVLQLVQKKIIRISSNGEVNYEE